MKYITQDEHIIRITLLLENSSDLPFKSFPWKGTVIWALLIMQQISDFNKQSAQFATQKTSHSILTLPGQMLRIRQELNEPVSELIYIHLLVSSGSGI